MSILISNTRLLLISLEGEGVANDASREGRMNVRAYLVLRSATGFAYGWLRAQEHTDAPTPIPCVMTMARRVCIGALGIRMMIWTVTNSPPGIMSSSYK